MPLITPTAYFPPAAWFAAAVRCGEWRLEAHENYQRKGFRNRARIAGPNGELLLSVPLSKGKNQRKPIREVTISDDDDWRREHIMAIRGAYGRAPFFEFYGEQILQLIRNSTTQLFDNNKSLITSLVNLLSLPIRISETSDFIRDLTYRDLPDLAPYQQVFTDRFGFRGELSILDAVFCLGPSFATHPLLSGADAGAMIGSEPTDLAPSVGTGGRKTTKT